jgi:hypothetical protein
MPLRNQITEFLRFLLKAASNFIDDEWNFSQLKYEQIAYTTDQALVEI